MNDKDEEAIEGDYVPAPCPGHDDYVMERLKQAAAETCGTINVGTIGHIDHGNTTLTSALQLDIISHAVCGDISIDVAAQIVLTEVTPHTPERVATLDQFMGMDDPNPEEFIFALEARPQIEGFDPASIIVKEKQPPVPQHFNKKGGKKQKRGHKYQQHLNTRKPIKNYHFNR